MQQKDMIIFANSFINGVIQYGITLWSHENFNLLQKVENLRIKVVKIIFGTNQTDNLNQTQLLKLINWSPIHEQAVIANNIRIHKTMYTSKPHKKFLKLTQNRNQEQIKYKYITTKLRSEESYNNIPLYIRNKEPYKFKLSYKNHRNNYKNIPNVVKNHN